MDTKQSDLTREKILHAAFGEIHRNGFQAASIANILADTGLTKGALYHYFPAKHALGLAVIDEVIRAGLEEMVFSPLREAEYPVEELLNIMQCKAEYADEDTVRLGCPLNNLMQEMSPLDDVFQARMTLILKAWKTAIFNALVIGQRQHQIRPDVDCEAAALFIVSAWEGCWGVAKNMQSVHAFRSCITQLQDYVLSLGPRPGLEMKAS
ncbi:MAG: TetR/AcrR family transcriptional regulator [Pseudomonadota bacterium]